MQVKRFNIVNPKKYTSNNEEKTHWAQIGTMTEFHKEDGSISRIMEMNDRSETFSLFPIEPKENNGGGNARPAPAANAGGAPDYPQEEINPEDIPF